MYGNEVDFLCYLDGVLQDSLRIEHDTLDSVNKEDDTIAKSQSSRNFV
jgi:hypothetical protein